MADQLKEFFNDTVNVTELTGGQYYTLLTTDASTQAVIKAVDVGSNTFPSTIVPQLQINTVNAGNIAESAVGSEIVDVSSTVRLATPTALEFKEVALQMPLSTTEVSLTSTYELNGEYATDADGLNYEGASPTSNSFTGYFAKASDGDVFYTQRDQNGASVTLFKVSGGLPGTSTTALSPGNYRPLAWDGGQYYYYLDSATSLVRYDIETETSTSITLDNLGSAATTASRCRSAYSNGYFFFRYDIYNAIVIDVSTGHWVQLSALSGQAAVNTYSDYGFHMDPTTKNFTIIYRTDSGYSTLAKYYIDNIGDFSASSSTNSTAYTRDYISTINTTTTSPLMEDSSPYTSIAMVDRNTFYSKGDASIGDPIVLYSWPDGATSITGTTVQALASSVFLIAHTEKTVASPTATQFPNSITLRVSGVETTL